MEIVNSVLELIGNTPILKISKFDTGPCELYIKMESENPGGSIKDRIAVSMIEAAEKSKRTWCLGISDWKSCRIARLSSTVVYPGATPTTLDSSI